MAILSCLISIEGVTLSRNGLRIRRSSEAIQTDTQQRRIAQYRQVAYTPITPTFARTQCTSHTEVVHVVSCGVEEIGEEGSSSTSSKSKVANSCVTHYVPHHLTIQMCVFAVSVCAAPSKWRSWKIRHPERVSCRFRCSE